MSSPFPHRLERSPPHHRLVACHVERCIECYAVVRVSSSSAEVSSCLIFGICTAKKHVLAWAHNCSAVETTRHSYGLTLVSQRNNAVTARQTLSLLTPRYIVCAPILAHTVTLQLRVFSRRPKSSTCWPYRCCFKAEPGEAPRKTSFLFAAVTR